VDRWSYAAEVDAPDASPLLEPDVGGLPDPDGGEPLSEPEPLPMFGQFLVEPEPELVPEFPEGEVVAALATSAPPVTSPEVSAPMARTLRKRMCITVVPFSFFAAPAPCEPVWQTVRSGSVRDRRVRCTGATSHATKR
jgi:hypothetical protein